MKLLLTGGTGFIGRYFVEAIAPYCEQIFLVVRPASLDKAQKMFASLSNISFIKGDVFNGDVCLEVSELNMLINEVTHIVHLAAKYDLQMSVYDAYTNNVVGVQNMLTLARRLKKCEFFHHVSSYSVNAGIHGLALENDLNLKTKYHDHYAKSKMQGEYMVRTMDLGKIKKRIYRPGIVVGHSHTGKIDKLDGPYYFFKLLNQISNSPFKNTPIFPLPFGPKTLFPVIPVDILVEWLVVAVTQPNKDEMLQGYHFVPDQPIELEKFAEKSVESFGMKTKVMRLKRINQFDRLMPALGMPKELLFYMFSDTVYSVANRKKDFPACKEVKITDCFHHLVTGAKDYFKRESSV